VALGYIDQNHTQTLPVVSVQKCIVTSTASTPAVEVSKGWSQKLILEWNQWSIIIVSNALYVDWGINLWERKMMDLGGKILESEVD